MGMTNMYFYCSNYVGNQFLIAIRCLCYIANISQPRGVATYLRIALSRGILEIYHTPLDLSLIIATIK